MDCIQCNGIGKLEFNIYGEVSTGCIPTALTKGKVPCYLCFGTGKVFGHTPTFASSSTIERRTLCG